MTITIVDNGIDKLNYYPYYKWSDKSEAERKELLSDI
jgi:hypothetical protein